MKLNEMGRLKLKRWHSGQLAMLTASDLAKDHSLKMFSVAFVLNIKSAGYPCQNFSAICRRSTSRRLLLFLQL